MSADPTAEDYSEDYAMVRDVIVERLNPRDDDAAECSIMADAVEAIADYVQSLPCTCAPDAGPPDYDVQPCGRCEALGRARDVPEDRS